MHFSTHIHIHYAQIGEGNLHDRLNQRYFMMRSATDEDRKRNLFYMVFFCILHND